MPGPPVPGAHGETTCARSNGETTCRRASGQNVLSFTAEKRLISNSLAATEWCLTVRKINSQAGLCPPPQASRPLLLQSIGRQDGRKDSLFSFGSYTLSLSSFLPSSLGTPRLLPLWPLWKAILNNSACFPCSGILGRKRWNTSESQGSDHVWPWKLEGVKDHLLP